MVSDERRTHVQGAQETTRHKVSVETEICKAVENSTMNDRVDSVEEVRSTPTQRKTRLSLKMRRGLTHHPCRLDSQATISIQHKKPTAEMQIGSQSG